jgi:Periplasmic binding protein
MKAPSRTLIIVMAAAPLAVLAGCGGSGNEHAECHQPDRHRLRTATHRHRGAARKQEQEGWNLGLKEFGRSVDGHRIVTYFEDTGGNPAVALSDARSLVQQKHIQLMEGPLLASEDAAVAAYLGAQRIPLDNLALCSSAQLTSDARYGNALSSGWLCDQPDVIAADYLYQDISICQVESVHGTLEDVPIKTYPDVEPWGTLPYRAWLQEFTADSTGVRPPDRCSAAGRLSRSAALPPCWPISVQLCRHDG